LQFTSCTGRFREFRFLFVFEITSSVASYILSV